MKKAFTLVELLAVIVILAVILVIAVPKIADTIEASKKSSLESSTKLVARTIENDYQSSQAAGSTFATSGSCTSYVDSNEYSACTYTITDGVASVTLSGKTGGKFDGLKGVGTKISATVSELVVLPTAKANFAAYSWSEIKNLAHAVTTGDLTYNDLSTTYHLAVGQTTTINLGSTLGNHTVRIANMSSGETNTCGTTGFSETACGFVMEFTDFVSVKAMSSTGSSSGGWELSDIRTYVNDTVYNALPSDLQSAIISTYVVSGHDSDSANNYFTNDKLYLLSLREVYAAGTDSWLQLGVSNFGTAYTTSRQLDYYKNKGVSLSNYSNAIKNSSSWWLRTVASDYTNMFMEVYSSGDFDISSSDSTLGVSPAFRIG